jgi:Na+-driven multidrug efflux pump
VGNITFFALAAVFAALAAAQYAAAQKLEADDPAKARKARQYAVLIFSAALVMLGAAAFIMFNRN